MLLSPLVLRAAIIWLTIADNEGAGVALSTLAGEVTM